MLCKNLLNSVCFWRRARLAINNNNKNHYLRKKSVLFFLVNNKWKKRNKKQLITLAIYNVSKWLKSLCCTMFFCWSLETQNRQLSNLEISKSSPIVNTPVWEFFNGYDYSLRLPEFPDLFGKAFLINLKFS